MRLNLFIVCLLLVLTGAMPGLAFASDKTFNAGSFTLENGLQVVVVNNPRVPVVTHILWIKAGSGDEKPGVSGIAHFLEHLMFKGTKAIPAGQYSRTIQRNAGNENAFTSHDYTAFFATLPSAKLPLAMALEADRMQNIAPPEADVLSERDVILEERRQRTDNQPDSRYYETLANALYPNHPYGRPIIGWASEMAKLTWADAKAYTGTWYAPNNAVLILSGDVTVEQAKELATKYYGSWPRKTLPPRYRPQAQNLPGDVTLRANDPALGENTLIIGLRVPSYVQDRHTALTFDVMTELLSGSPASRLYQSLVVKQKLATNVDFSYDGQALDDATLWISATPAEGVSFEALREGLRDELDKLADDGPTRTEMQASLRRLREGAVFARDSVAGPAMIIGKAMVTGQTLDEIENWPRDVSKITAADVIATARTYLSREAWVKTPPVTAELAGRKTTPPDATTATTADTPLAGVDESKEKDAK